MQNTKVLTESDSWASQVELWVSEAGIMSADVESNVRSAFSRVNRSLFVEPAYRDQAGQDVDLPLPHGQWLTRPSVQIRMMALVNLQRRMRVLELGFGSGYLCAVMAAAGAQVFGLETVGSFAQSSRKQLDSLGHHGVVVRRGDGKKGWQEVAPFDAIIVSYPVESESDLPLDQVALGGALVAPLRAGDGQRLTVWRRTSQGLRRIVFEEVSIS